MAPVKSHFPPIRWGQSAMFCQLDGAGPLYQQVYRALRTDILSRRLPPGTRLPSTRALAADLGVSRNVAMLAYEQLLGEGYTPAPRTPPRLARAGTRAIAIARRTRLHWDLRGAPLAYDFRFGRPAFADFP